MILVIGQNPARSSKTGEPFVGTRSGKRLLRWFELAGVEDYMLMNLSDEKTEDNGPLKASVIRAIASSDRFRNTLLRYDRVIAVGRQAQKAVEIAFPHHSNKFGLLFVPHPSYRNRYFNLGGTEDFVVGLIKAFAHGDRI